MSKIKSERATEALSVMPLNRANVEYCLDKGVVNGSLKANIENIISLAEQEAEERAIEALKGVLKYEIPKELMPSYVDHFKQLLNDGGQGNE